MNFCGWPICDVEILFTEINRYLSMLYDKFTSYLCGFSLVLLDSAILILMRRK